MSQYSTSGSTCSFAPNSHASTRLSTSGCMETPKSTSIVPSRSTTDRGRAADQTPTTIAIRSHSRRPPKTSDAVAGQARETSRATG